ncbi:Protein TRM32 [Cardamine amara subsp. amara]|uniref:Protein TRM32 n=1 Tax=Cardamine amara subsp. amara TaxID=228776 RepID=A0ABD0ZC25_CARAN
MEKEICRRHISREGIGCVWVFMSMFDFRNGGSNHKLLIDKKRGSKRIIGISGMFETKVEKQLTCDCEESEAGVQSVKKLIEDEIDDKTQQKCDFECRGGGTKARNRKRRSKTFSKTSEDINVLVAGDGHDHAEKSDDQCPRLSQNEEDLVNYDSEEKFSELIKRLIAQKDSEVESCKNLEDAFQVLGCSSSDSKNSQCTQAIVILKSEPNSLDVVSSLGTHATRNKAKYGRFGSHFILSRIRRRLKSAVGKNPCNAQHDSDPDPNPDPDALSSNMSQKCCLGEEIETNSGRHVSGGKILPDIASKNEANKEDTIHGSEDSKKSTCGIYIAAKKHLSEMLAEGDIDVDSPDKEEPRILGKILALPEFSTPESSPRMTSALGHQITEKPMIQQCSSEDYSQLLGLDLDKHEETEFTSNMQVPEGISDTGMEEEEKTVLDSFPEAISSSIIEQDAYVDEDHEHKQSLEKEVFNEEQLPCSPPNSSVRMSECQENTTDVLGKSSPVSVLEPIFTDDDTSPNSSRFSSVEMRMQPVCIRFDELDSPRPEKDNDLNTSMDDKELALAYIQAVVESSDLNWEELLARSFYSEQLLEQALLGDIDFCSTNLCSDKKLLFDCINEVLMEFCGNGPWISFIKPAVRFFPDMENATEMVQEEVYWHLLPLPSPHTLDQIVWKDLARDGNWMDLRFDIGCISSEIGEIFLDELLEEIISNCTDMVQAEIINTTTLHNLIP